MLLALTESDLINDYGIRNRGQRQTILDVRKKEIISSFLFEYANTNTCQAIDAIKTSDDRDDEDEEEGVEDDLL